jgi:membrane fusion protein, multidrug efflux system
VAAGAFEGLKFDLQTLRARHDLAALRLAHTEIRAPFAGVVAGRHVRLGQMLQPGVAAFRITNPDPLKAQVHVPERELGRLAVGQQAAVRFDALGGRSFPAWVSLVAPTVDPQTATVKVTVDLEPAPELRPGMFGRVSVVLDRRAQALQIPRAALLDAEGTPAVFVVEEGTARERRVRVGLAEAGQVEVLSGLDGHEQVVIVGQSGLKDGHAVRVVSLETALARR